MLAAFDELKQGIKDIEFLSDPTIGEVRIGCPESISAAILQPICEKFSQQYPRVVLDVDTVNTLSFAQKLRDRSLASDQYKDDFRSPSRQHGRNGAIHCDPPPVRS